MGRDDSNAPLYIALGALAAVGAGYLVWRYGLSDETKDRARAAMRDGVERARATLHENVDRARDTMQTARITR